MNGRVYCDIPFHADVDEAAKARRPSVAWLTCGMARYVIGDDRITADVHCLLRPETAHKRGRRVPSREGTGKVRVSLSPVHTSNNVEATLSKQRSTLSKERNFERKTRSTLLPFLATKSNVASTLLLMWTGLNRKVIRSGARNR